MNAKFNHIEILKRAIEAATDFLEQSEKVESFSSLPGMADALRNLIALYVEQKNLPSQAQVDHIQAEFKRLKAEHDALSEAFQKHKAAQPAGLATSLGMRRGV